MKLTVLIAFFFFALVAPWFATVPQATMLLAKPVYQRLAPEVIEPGSEMVWIANVVWIPIAGAAFFNGGAARLASPIQVYLRFLGVYWDTRLECLACHVGISWFFRK